MIKPLLEFLKGKGHALIFPVHCFSRKICSVRGITFLKRNESLVFMRLEDKAICGMFNSQNVYGAQIFLVTKKILD